MKVGLIRGNGIGPEISDATVAVLNATGLDFEWVPVSIADEAIDKSGHPLPQESVKLLKELKVAIKAPLMVEKFKGRLTCVHEDGSAHIYPSLNNAIRRELGLFMCPRPIRGIPNVSGTHEKMDCVIMREITEDVYAGIEHTIGDVAAECVKLTTRAAATRAAEYSFDFARKNGRKKVTCVHKANAISLTDGLFLSCFREVAAKNPDIESNDFMVDATAFYMAKYPEMFDVVVASNQYGDILSDLCAGLVGSLGLAPGANIGEHCSVFEASHGAAPDIAGKGIANPVALILSGALMLRHLNYIKEAQAVEDATREILSERQNLTPDLGGTATTVQLTDAICKRVQEKLRG
jgi:isocitrate dehydrogenase (NAD+)